MEVPKTKFKVNQSVYIFTKDGLVEDKIVSIMIHVREDEIKARYYFGDHEGYNEDQIIADYPKAKKKLEENANQLVLMIS